MAFQSEPVHTHGALPKQGSGVAILLCNLGTPDAPSASALRSYLGEFLSDPRVVEIPKFAWWPILHGIILRTRPAKSAQKYASVWLQGATPERTGSPLRVWTAANAAALAQSLAKSDHSATVRMAMRYGQPSIASELDALKREGIQKILILPLYPQYSGATTASVSDAVYAWARKIRALPELRFVNHYHDHPAYIAALAQSVREHWQVKGRGARLVMSFHGVPQRSLHLGDPYHCECYKTARLLAQALEIKEQDYLVTFQSRFGKAKWLEPYTEPSLVALAQQGVQHVDVICPGFAVDCLETLEEINIEAREAFVHAGGSRFEYIACLNNHPAWIEALTQIAMQHLSGWPLQASDGALATAQRNRALALGAKS